jgi:cytochrome c peroxidase
MNGNTSLLFKVRLLLVLTLFTGLFSGCKKDDDPDTTPADPIKFEIPAGFPAPVYQFANNAVTDQRFELGRKLFYDPILSRNNTISCGSCHQQGGAFAHIDHRLSHGIDGLTGNRNSPPIFNLAWSTHFFWDGGVNHIEVQPINPIQNPVEMDETLANVINKLRASATYRDLFKQAYGSDSITSQNMLRAIAQFMAVMVSANSKYDKYTRGQAGGEMTAQELSGLQIFRQKCASCHTEPLFTDNSFRNNGLDAQFSSDPGRFTITLNPADSGKFKVPSLRNVEVSFPFMHDGRFQTLAQVLDHYSSGIVSSSTLDPSLAGGIPLTASEKADLIKFLRTLTDHTFINNPRFSEVQ